MAVLNYNNFMNTYWDDDLEYFVDYYKEGFRCTVNDLVWGYGCACRSIATYYEATKDARVVETLQKEFDAFCENRSEEWLLTVNGGANPAVDDSVGSLAFYVLVYRITGDKKALSFAHTIAKNIVKTFADGDTAHGLWYCYFDDSQVAHEGDNEMKSFSSSAHFVYNVLTYHELTKGTEDEDLELYQDAIDLFYWLENNGRRHGQTIEGVQVPNDGLYFASCVVSPTSGLDIPKGYHAGDSFVVECHSFSSLDTNMIMAVNNKKIYEITGIRKYLDNAIQTANSLTGDFYRVNGTYLNDRDAWADSWACTEFVKEVLPLEGVDKELGKMFIRTSLSIMKYAYYEEEGFLGANWYGETVWDTAEHYGIPMYLTTCANTLNMIMSALLAVKLGYVDWDEELPVFPETYTPLPLPQCFATIKKQYDSSWGK